MVGMLAKLCFLQLAESSDIQLVDPNGCVYIYIHVYMHTPGFRVCGLELGG